MFAETKRNIPSVEAKAGTEESKNIILTLG
jgi:hypothetical protein